MTESRDLPHIVYSATPDPFRYTSPQVVLHENRRPQRNSIEHATRLLAQLDQSWTAAAHNGYSRIIYLKQYLKDDNLKKAGHLQMY